MVINVDFDNTIVDTVGILVSKLNTVYNKQYSVDNVYYYDYSKLYKELEGEIFGKLFDEKSFYSKESLYYGAKEFIAKHRKNNTVRLVTVASLSNFTNKMEFLFNNNMIFHDFKRCSVNKSKIDMRGEILIDDKIDELRNSNATIKILLKACGDKDWNKTDCSDDVYIAHNWSDVDEIVSFFTSKDDIFEKI